VRYKKLLEELQSGVIKGQNKYPETVAEAYSLMLCTSKRLGYKRNRSRFRNGQKRVGNKITFLFRKKTKHQTMTTTSQWMLRAKMGSHMKESAATIASG